MKKLMNPFLISTTLVFGAWFIITKYGNVDPIFLPTPHTTLEALLNLAQTTTFWKDVWASCLRVFWGFLLAALIAYPVVILSLINEKIKGVVFYIVEFFRYLPIPVFIPVTILWFGVDDMGKIIIVFLGTFAQMIPMFYDSAMLYENKFKAFKHSMKWKRWKILKTIVLPGSMPYVMDNARLCFGWAWTYLIIAELLGAENGIGYAIIRAQRYLATDKIFAYIITIGLIGLLMDRTFSYLRKKIFKWV